MEFFLTVISVLLAYRLLDRALDIWAQDRRDRRRDRDQY